MDVPYIRAVERPKSSMAERAVQQSEVEDVMMHAADFGDCAGTSRGTLPGDTRRFVHLQIVQRQDLFKMRHIALVGVGRKIGLEMREGRHRPAMIEGSFLIGNRNQQIAMRLQHTIELAKCAQRIGDMLQNM